MNELISTCWHQLGWSVKALMACDDSPAFIFLACIYINYTKKDVQRKHKVHCVCSEYPAATEEK